MKCFWGVNVLIITVKELNAYPFNNKKCNAYMHTSVNTVCPVSSTNITRIIPTPSQYSVAFEAESMFIKLLPTIAFTARLHKNKIQTKNVPHNLFFHIIRALRSLENLRTFYNTFGDI